MRQSTWVSTFLAVVHILLEADPADVGKTRLETMEESVRAEMRRASPRIGIGDISRKDGCPVLHGER